MPAQNEPNDRLIKDLDDDSIRGTGDCLDLKERASILVTASMFKGVFQPTLSAQKLNYSILQILQGCESKVRKWLATNPNLLEKGSATDFSGREFTSKNERALTPIQAAIVARDFAPNENSTGIFELLVEKLKHQHRDNWRQILHEQTLEIYTESLKVYVKKQEEKIRTLEMKQRTGEVKEEFVMVARARCQAYLDALDSGDLDTILTAHTNPDTSNAPDAQKDHAIEVKQELIDAIANASNDAIQVVLDDPTIDTTLSNLIKAFREEVDTICRSEIINNPQHLIKLFELYNNLYDRVRNTDPDWKKRELFWCHLVGYVQRYLSASDAQIFANPSLFSIVKPDEINQRSFNFKYGGGSIFPLAFDSHSGLGYKFALGCPGRAMHACESPRARRFGVTVELYKIYVKQKQKAFGNIILRRQSQLQPHAEFRCVTQ